MAKFNTAHAMRFAVTSAENDVSFEPAKRRHITEDTSIELKMPNIEARSAYAVTSKIAGRLNASAVSEEEHKKLLAERAALLDKKFAGAMTRHEENRLSYVRWSLDRIEDAKYGQALDLLEEHASHYKNLVSEVNRFTEQLHSYVRGKR
ncbi:UNVERIFIED_ORG: hypothetical protein J2740_002604 [Rhizobium nepotum]|nr:hypothetical protein [Rhizobium nepotum]